MTDAAFLDPQIGFYRRANGKRSWREERLGAVLEMIRNGDLWKPGDRLLVGLTAQAMARAGDLEAEWAGSVAPAEEGERDNPAHAEYYRRKDFYGDLKNGKDSQRRDLWRHFRWMPRPLAACDARMPRLGHAEPQRADRR